MKRFILLFALVVALAGVFSAVAKADYLQGSVRPYPGTSYPSGAGAVVQITNRDNGATFYKSADGNGTWDMLLSAHPLYGWYLRATKRDGACYLWSGDPVVVGGGAYSIILIPLYLRYRSYIC